MEGFYNRDTLYEYSYKTHPVECFFISETPCLDFLLNTPCRMFFKSETPCMGVKKMFWSRRQDSQGYRLNLYKRGLLEPFCWNILQTIHSRYYRGDITWVVILHF